MLLASSLACNAGKRGDPWRENNAYMDIYHDSGDRKTCPRLPERSGWFIFLNHFFERQEASVKSSEVEGSLCLSEDWSSSILNPLQLSDILGRPVKTP